MPWAQPWKTGVGCFHILIITTRPSSSMISHHLLSVFFAKTTTLIGTSSAFARQKSGRNCEVGLAASCALLLNWPGQHNFRQAFRSLQVAFGSCDTGSISGLISRSDATGENVLCPPACWTPMTLIGAACSHRESPLVKSSDT